MTYIFK